MKKDIKMPLPQNIFLNVYLIIFKLFIIENKTSFETKISDNVKSQWDYIKILTKLEFSF